jgi:hypothetical protein
VAWFGALQNPWERMVGCHPGGRVINGDLSGIPWFYWTIALGLAATLLSSLSQWRFQFSWAVMIVGLAFVITLTANVKSRFRFVFEPFYYLYLAGIPHLILCCLKRLARPSGKS